MRTKEMDEAQAELHAALENAPGGDEGFAVSTTILSMALAYVLYGKQEVERLAEANPEVDPNDPQPYQQIFNSVMDTMANEYAPRDGSHPEVTEAIRESAAKYIKGYSLDDPEEIVQQLVETLTRFYENEGAGHFKITIEPTRSPDRLMSSRYVPMLNAELINILFNFDMEGFTENPETHVATLKRDGSEIEVEGYDMIKSLSTSPLKLLDIIIAYLTFDNYFDADKDKERAPDTIRTVVEIPLYEYAEAREISIEPRELDDPGAQEREKKYAATRKSKFISEIERDLDTLARFRVAGRITRGPRAGEYVKLVIIGPNHAVVNDYIRVSVPAETAQYLLETHLLMEYAPQLQRLKDSNPNTYRVGRRLLLHNTMYSNQNKKTANTLKVATIIASTPFIPSWEKLEARGSRNWKQKIKVPLETVFARLEENGFLVSWQYRDARTKQTLTQKQAEYLTPVDYMNLMVDFKLIDNPEGTQRRRRAIEKRAKTTK